MSHTDEQRAVRAEFRRAVNMGVATLARWLASDESKSVGWSDGDGESVGHRSGRRIVQLLGKKSGGDHARRRGAHAQGDRLHPPASGATTLG